MALNKTNRKQLKVYIENLWGEKYSENIWSDFEKTGLNSFISITQNDHFVYVLDWHHECYMVNLIYFDAFKEDLESKYNGYTSFIPDGDYYIFISKDLENIWFGHPWEKTVTIIGSKLIEEFTKNKTLLSIS